MTKTECNKCRSVMSVPDSYLGKEVKCSQCGGRFIGAPLSQTTTHPEPSQPSSPHNSTPPGKQPNTDATAALFQKEAPLGCTILVAAPLLAALIWVVCSMWKDANARARAAEKREEYLQTHQKDEQSNDTIGAWTYMQLFVEQKLKNPKSAGFQFGGSRSVSPLGNNRYQISSHVDATNSFGAKIRTNFHGVIVKDGSRWTLESLEFDQ